MINYAQAVDRLIAERRRRKLRQSDVEEMSGLGKGYISILERGSKIATVPTFLRWCWALEVNPFCPHRESE